MKKSLGVILILCLTGLSGLFAQSESGRTEEYAIVDVFEQGKRKIIRITIGEQPAEEKEWKKAETDRQ